MLWGLWQRTCFLQQRHSAEASLSILASFGDRSDRCTCSLSLLSLVRAENSRPSPVPALHATVLDARTRDAAIQECKLMTEGGVLKGQAGAVTPQRTDQLQ